MVADLVNRAHAILQIKSVDSEQRIIEGIASTPTPDRGGDSLDSAGAQFVLPMPFLWKHKEPIGEVFAADVRPNGIWIKARISRVAADAPETLRNRIEEAWHSIKAQPPLVRGLSVGWAPLQYVKTDGPFKRISKWIWAETSAVEVPMNSEATIVSVKSCDQQIPAASGTGSAIGIPGASGIRRTTPMNASISEQLSAEQQILKTKGDRFNELMNLDQTNGGLETDEQKELDTLGPEIDALTLRVKRLKTSEAAQAAQASPIMAPTYAPAIRTSRTAEPAKKDFPAWMPFVRAVMAKAAGAKTFTNPIDYAKRWQRDMPEVIEYLKAAPGTTDPTFGSPGSPSPAWGSQLVPLQTGTAFVDQLMPATIIGRLNLVPTPFLTRIVEQTGGATVEWVGQASKKPVSELAFTDFSMPRHKMAGIVVISDELARSSQPDAEEVVRRSLNQQITKFMDRQFIDISVGAGANNPASITNSVTPITASGTDIASMLVDFNTALASFDGTDLGTDGLAIVTTSAIARGLSMMLTAFGARQFPDMTPTGGTVLGYRLIVSNNVPAGDIVFIKQDQIRISSERQIMIDVSNQATLDMGDGNGTTFNLWQNNCIGLRAEQYVTWLKDREEAVAVISGAAYGPGIGSV